MKLLVAATVIMAVCSATQCLGEPGPIPKGMYIGITAPGGTSKDGDDQGPSQEVKDKLCAQMGINLTETGINWKQCCPDDPGDKYPKYDWTGFDNGTKPTPKGSACICHISLNDLDTNFWANKLKAKDPARFWRLAEGFITAAAKHARDNYGVRYFHAPGNEPSLSLNPKWHWIYAEVSNHVYDAVKRANPDNQVIIGALVVGDHGHVGALYEAGAKFDIMDIHAYGGRIGKWPKTSKENPSIPALTSPEAPKARFVSINQIIETHKEMERRGDFDKKIFLGEGWSCFPEPDDIEAKYHGKDVTYTDAQAEHFRQAVLNGYRDLITPKPGYDPKWVFGAKFFTLNDFWGSMHWKERAEPVYNDGKIDHWMLDGVWIPYAPDALDPKYRPWGIVDAEGKPKGDIAYNFPPYIPHIKLVGIIANGLSSVKKETGLSSLEKDTGYRIKITATNNEKEPITDVRFGIYATGSEWTDSDILNIAFTDTGDKSPIKIESEQKATHEFSMVVPSDFNKRSARAYAEIYYKWKGKPYYADAWVNFDVE